MRAAVKDGHIGMRPHEPGEARKHRQVSTQVPSSKQREMVGTKKLFEVRVAS